MNELERVEEQIDKLNQKLVAARSELKRLSSELHMTTGHAFVCFHRESTRNRFLELFNEKPTDLRELSYAQMACRVWRAPCTHVRHRCARACRLLTATAAPDLPAESDGACPHFIAAVCGRAWPRAERKRYCARSGRARGGGVAPRRPQHSSAQRATAGSSRRAWGPWRS